MKKTRPADSNARNTKGKFSRRADGSNDKSGGAGWQRPRIEERAVWVVRWLRSRC